MIPSVTRRSFRTFLRVASALCAIALVSAAPKPVQADGPLYTITDLGSLGCCDYEGWESTALGLNNLGDVVGFAGSPADPSVPLPFLYHGGQMTAIGAERGAAHGVNDAGQAVGYVDAPNHVVVRAFVYQNGVFTDLGTLPAVERSAAAYAINRTGTIAGITNLGRGSRAFVYWRGLMLPLPGLAFEARGVNDGGDVTGLLGRFQDHELRVDRGFLFSGLRLIDLGTMDGDPGSLTRPAGINNHRQIAGTASMMTRLADHAFLWQDGVFQDLGTLRGGYSDATGLNNRGDVVGLSDASAFVYRDGAMIDLNQAIARGESIWPIVQDVTAINDRGQIVGDAYFEIAEGVVRLRACLLTPVAPDAQ
jgi:chitinase